MIANVWSEAGRRWVGARRLLEVCTSRATEFVDITDRIAALVSQAGIRLGIASIQTRHTTTAIVVNEHEPLLLRDQRDVLDRLAPEHVAYAHDDLSRRTVHVGPDERRNGHAHCRALVLRTSESVHIVDGALELGRWQRIFLVELDGGQRREVSVLLLGEPG